MKPKEQLFEISAEKGEPIIQDFDLTGIDLRKMTRRQALPKLSCIKVEDEATITYDILYSEPQKTTDTRLMRIICNYFLDRPPGSSQPAYKSVEIRFIRRSGGPKDPTQIIIAIYKPAGENAITQYDLSKILVGGLKEETSIPTELIENTKDTFFYIDFESATNSKTGKAENYTMDKFLPQENLAGEFIQQKDFKVSEYTDSPNIAEISSECFGDNPLSVPKKIEFKKNIIERALLL